jgi:hypothetical protein
MTNTDTLTIEQKLGLLLMCYSFTSSCFAKMLFSTKKGFISPSWEHFPDNIAGGIKTEIDNEMASLYKRDPEGLIEVKDFCSGWSRNIATYLVKEAGLND